MSLLSSNCPLVSLFSGFVKLSELKGISAPSKSSLLVPDSLMTQREGGASWEGEAEEEQQQEEVGEEDDGVLAVRQRNRKAAVSDGGEVRVRGRRQRDFDPAAALEDEGAEPQRVEGEVWTQNQQKLLEVSLQLFPRGTAERWDRIAKGVPGKTKVRVHWYQSRAGSSLGVQLNFIHSDSGYFESDWVLWR